MKAEYYETIYKYVIKTLANKSTPVFGGLKSFEVGRPGNAKRNPYIKQILLMAVVAYLVVGLLI